MFDELVSSGIKREIAPARGLMVAALHGALIVVAVRTTMVSLPSPPLLRTDTMVFVTELPLRSPDLPGGPSVPGGVEIPARPADLPPAPLDMPTTLPPVSDGPVLDPARLRQAMSVGSAGPVGLDSIGFGAVLARAEVDQPAEAVHQPQPRYPPVLQQAGIQGRVLVEFIIDTLGHTEPGSLRVLESNNAGFEAAAAETLRRSVFRPARVQGRPVRQLTVQSVAFRIAP